MDFGKIKNSQKEEILKYVSSKGVNKLDSYLTKRLAKFLLAMGEYNSSANAYEIAYKKSNDVYNLLNACYIRSKFLKEFDNSNRKLKKLIKEKKQFAPAYYNLGCNYNREYTEFCDTKNNEYIENLKTKAEQFLQKAFTLDKGLYSEALKDPALTGLDIESIFKNSKKDNNDK
jgi:tetratricopeptide (TPR) repeat protein